MFTSSGVLYLSQSALARDNKDNKDSEGKVRISRPTFTPMSARRTQRTAPRTHEWFTDTRVIFFHDLFLFILYLSSTPSAIRPIARSSSLFDRRNPDCGFTYPFPRTAEEGGGALYNSLNRDNNVLLRHGDNNVVTTVIGLLSPIERRPERWNGV